MKKFFLVVLLLAMFFAGCKKENTLTADGKPIADAVNNVLRIEVSSNEQYTLGVSFNYIFPASERTNFVYMHNATPYEYVTTAVVGQTADIGLSATYGANLTCVIYYKGLKVPMDKITTEKVINDPSTTSHIRVIYEVDK